MTTDTDLVERVTNVLMANMTANLGRSMANSAEACARAVIALFAEREKAAAELAAMQGGGPDGWRLRRVAEQSAHDWRMRVQSDKDILLRQANLIDETQNAADAWKAECLRYRAMTAWDHLRAAVEKSGLGGRFVATLIGLSLVASALRTAELVSEWAL